MREELYERIGRLETLILKAEIAASTVFDGPCCPWCREVANWTATGHRVDHKSDCPAFSGPGVVR